MCDSQFFSVPNLLLQFTTFDHASNVEGLLNCAHLFGSELEFHQTPLPTPTFTPLIWDTGASYGLTAFKNDFIDYHKADISVKDVTKFN